jgi:transcriptional regulator with XRE-family HTH domain
LNKVDIKERIKQGLEIREITQTQLAARANIDKGQLSSYISGKYKPRQNNIDALAAALNVNEAWLMGFDVPMERVSNNVETDQLVSKSVECKEILEICEQLSTHNQRKVLTYSKNLLSTQQMEEDLLAAHARTDVEQTPECVQHDLNIMNDDSKWEE